MIRTQTQAAKGAFAPVTICSKNEKGRLNCSLLFHFEMRIPLELVAERKLHLASPFAACGSEGAKGSTTDVGVGINKVLVVKGIERFGEELQLLAFAPWKLDLLLKPEIYRVITGSA